MWNCKKERVFVPEETQDATFLVAYSYDKHNKHLNSEFYNV
jgi:hypothetical protein